MSPVRVGTCSWKFESWAGLVYSAAKGIDYLASVPDDFLFTVKVPNSITLTHSYAKGKKAAPRVNEHFLSEGLFRQFLERLGPMAPRVGSFMFQCEYLNRQKMPSQKEFIRRLGEFVDKIDPGLPCGVEIRNPNYLNPAWFEFLAAHRLHPVLLDGYWMPGVRSVYDRFREQIQAQPTVVIRLHGSDRKEIEEMTQGRWDRVVESRQQDLAGIVEIIRELSLRGTQVYANVNNHYEGSAPLTIRSLRALPGWPQPDPAAAGAEGSSR